MPLRAFIDSDNSISFNFGFSFRNVLMPLRAFIDSDLSSGNRLALLVTS